MHRFSRLELLTSPAGLARLDRARVAVVGLGGVGSYAVEALARAGVGWLVADLLHGDLSYVIDAIDTVAAKAGLIHHCVERGLPIVSVMGAGNKFDPLAFKVGDISRTHTCPLAKAVRKALREKGIERGVKVVYSTEKPAAPLAEVPSCHGGCICPHRDEQTWNCTKRRQIPGSTSYVPPIAGLIAAGVVIRDLLKAGG